MYHHDLLIAALSVDHRSRLEGYAANRPPTTRERRRRRLGRLRRAPERHPDG